MTIEINRDMSESDNEFQANMLDAHNRLRAQHGAAPLVWCNVNITDPTVPYLIVLQQDCARNAQRAADACQAKNMLFHSNHDGQGQNVLPMHALTDSLTRCARLLCRCLPSLLPTPVSLGTTRSRTTTSGDTQAPAPATSPRHHSPVASPSTQPASSQVVWATTTKVGGARSRNGTYVVCNYDPPVSCWTDRCAPLLC